MKFDQAVVVGCDKKYEHTLDWWLSKYKQRNNLPVIFANFGVSEPKLQWAKQTFVDVIDARPENNEFSWGLKQQAVLEAGKTARWVMWIDLDCEINGNIEAFFNPLTCDDDFGIAIDVPEFRYPGEIEVSKNQLQAGLFLTRPQGRVFRKWLEEMPFHKCDQRAISSIYHREKSLNKFFKLYDWGMHCPRLALPFQIEKHPCLPDVIHWTGPIGDTVVSYKAMLSKIAAN